jgi:hypothetical protein
MAFLCFQYREWPIPANSHKTVAVGWLSSFLNRESFIQGGVKLSRYILCMHGELQVPWAYLPISACIRLSGEASLFDGEFVWMIWTSHLESGVGGFDLYYSMPLVRNCWPFNCQHWQMIRALWDDTQRRRNESQV